MVSGRKGELKKKKIKKITNERHLRKILKQTINLKYIFKNINMCVCVYWLLTYRLSTPYLSFFSDV